MKHVRLKIGDCCVIPLPDGRFAYGQFVYFDRVCQYGYMLKVFDLITDKPATVRRLEGRKAMFPPVFVGLEAPVATGRWKLIGSMPVENFQYPRFRVCHNDNPGSSHEWELWDGDGFRYLGKLPEKLRKLEYFGIWGGEILEERIATGVNPFEQFR